MMWPLRFGGKEIKDVEEKNGFMDEMQQRSPGKQAI
jgi:hypothetical protein